MKDNFSSRPENYALYRPDYPAELYDFIISGLKTQEKVWDCGTGNGQVARQLLDYFTEIYASDISQAQLDIAFKQPRIHYSLQPAEKTNFPDHFFDLILVAQAVHWFNFNEFYREVNRTLKPDGRLAVIGYGLVKITEEVDRVIVHFYTKIVGPFWDAERRHIDEAYKSIPFPFAETPSPAFSINREWSFEQMIGYLRTWSAVKHYQKQKGVDPIDLVYEDLKKVWGEKTKRVVSFPLFLRLGEKG